MLQLCDSQNDFYHHFSYTSYQLIFYPYANKNVPFNCMRKACSIIIANTNTRSSTNLHTIARWSFVTIFFTHPLFTRVVYENITSFTPNNSINLPSFSIFTFPLLFLSFNLSLQLIVPTTCTFSKCNSFWGPITLFSHSSTTILRRSGKHIKHSQLKHKNARQLHFDSFHFFVIVC